MGVVIKQSFWGSAMIYIGVAVGYFNSLLFLPKFYEWEQQGLIRLIQTNGLMLMPIAVLGMGGAFIKYYPSFKNDALLQSKIIGIQTIFMLGSNLLLGILYLFFKNEIGNYFGNSAYNDYIFLSYLILFSQSFYEYLFNISRSYLNISVPSLLKEVLLRILQMCSFLAYGLKLISFETSIYLVIATYWVILIFLITYLLCFHSFKISFTWKGIEKELFVKIFKFAGFIFLMNISTSIISNISYLQTTKYLGLDANGIFTICVFIGIIIEMPKRAMSLILGPIVANNFDQNEMKEVETVYQKASITLGIMSLLLAIGIFTNLEDLFHLIPKGDDLQKGYYVVILIGLSKVIIMMFGPSGVILMYSEYKNMMLYLLIGSAGILMILNTFLIPAYGLDGAGLALLISSGIDQITRFLLIKYKLKLRMFTRQHLYLLLITTVTVLLAWYFPIRINPIINIAVRSVLTGLVFTGLLYFLKVSVDINKIIDLAIKRVIK